MKEKIIEFLKVAVYPVFIYLKIDLEVVGVLCTLMIIDGIMGGIKSHVLFRNFKFRVLFFGFLMKIIVLMVPALFALVGIGIGKDFTLFVDITFKIMILSEFYSILGNIYAIRTGKDVERVDAVTMMLKALREALYSIINNMIKKIQQAGGCETPNKE